MDAVYKEIIWILKEVQYITGVLFWRCGITNVPHSEETEALESFKDTFNRLFSKESPNFTRLSELLERLNAAITEYEDHYKHYPKDAERRHFRMRCLNDQRAQEAKHEISLDESEWQRILDVMYKSGMRERKGLGEQPSLHTKQDIMLDESKMISALSKEEDLSEAEKDWSLSQREELCSPKKMQEDWRNIADYICPDGEHTPLNELESKQHDAECMRIRKKILNASETSHWQWILCYVYQRIIQVELPNQQHQQRLNATRIGRIIYTALTQLQSIQEAARKAELVIVSPILQKSTGGKASLPSVVNHCGGRSILPKAYPKDHIENASCKLAAWIGAIKLKNQAVTGFMEKVSKSHSTLMGELQRTLVDQKFLLLSFQHGELTAAMKAAQFPNAQPAQPAEPITKDKKAKKPKRPSRKRKCVENLAEDNRYPSVRICP